MRRLMIITTLVALAQTLAGFSPAPAQTRATTTALRRIQVNAQTIIALPSGKTYVVDLTQRGVIYDFDAKTSKINLSRVMVRTAQGEVAIGPWLEKTFLKGKLAGFKWTSQSFIIRTRSTGTLQTPPTGTSPSNNPSKLISCGSEICSCVGEDSCDDMLYFTPLCGDIVFCKIDPISHQQVCSCALRRPQ